MSVIAYPASAVAGDYLRSAGGLALTGAPLVLVPTPPAVTGILLAAAGIFLMYGVVSLRRQLTRIEISEAGIHVRGSWFGDVAWRELTSLRLRYYSTRRDRTGGWMQLTLVSGKRRLNVDSRATNFHLIVTRAAAVACDNRLSLDPTTVSNLVAMGVPCVETRPESRPR